MEKYNLTQTGQEVQNILDNATPQSDLTAEVERAQEAERLLGEGIQQNADDIDSIEGKIPSAATSENKLTDKEYVDGQVDDEKNRAQGVEGTLQDNIDAEETRAKAAERQNADDIDALEAVVPSGATSENKLATESYVNDAVATSSATFRGTFNLVNDLHLTLEATHANIATALAAAIATADNNDFAFVLIPTDAETPTVIGSIERYKFNGTDWAYEYTLNNSGFTQAQWDAINSGITSGDVTKLRALPTNAQLTTLLNGKQDTLTFDNVPTENSLNPVKSGGVHSAIKDEETRAKAAEKANADDIDAIEEKIPSSASSSNQLATASDVDSLSAAIEAILLLIPSAASSLNQLADKAFVNSSISTATATFRGTFNLVNDLHLTLAATHAQVGNALAVAISDEDNNDYCFVQIPTVETAPNEITQTDRYKFNGISWEYEYTLNNSGFTSAQWTAINSGITEALVTKLSALPTNAELTATLGTLSSGITAINQKIPAAASQSNKLVDTAALESYIVQVLGVLTVSYNITSTDGHVTLHIEQTNGKITAFTMTTADIASAAALALKASQADLTALYDQVVIDEGRIDGLNNRMNTAEGDIDQNTSDIALLRAQYNALTESDIIVGALPTTGVANVIYRVPGTSTYADWMYFNNAWVKVAEYTVLDGFLYKGIATPTGSPAASAVKMFYYALTPGTYTNFGGIVVTEGISVLKYDGANWTQDKLYYGDGGVFDISKYNLTNGQPTEYADLAAALGTNGANVPAAVRKGGMSVKFVESSDNKYVQYRLMTTSFSTTESDWQGVDNDPIAGSDNLIKSSGVAQSLIPIKSVVGGDFLSKSYSLSSSQGVYETINLDIKAGTTIKINITSSATWGANKFYIYFGSTAYYLPTSGSKTITLSNDIEELNLGLSSSDVTQAGDCQLDFEIIGDLDSRINTAKDFASDLDRYSSKFPCTDNTNLNKIIKELYLTYITEENLSNVNKVRVFNTYVDGDGKYVYGIIIYITGLSYTLDMTVRYDTPLTELPAYMENQNKRYRTIVDLSTVEEGAFVDFDDAEINTRCLNIDYSPRLGFILFKEGYRATNALDVSDNQYLKDVIKELYMPESVLSRITKVRVYNGYYSFYKVSFFDTNNVVIRELNSSQGDFYAESSNTDSSAIVNFDAIPEGEYQDYDDITINECVSNLNYWPILYRIRNTILDKFKVSIDDNLNNIVKELNLPTANIRERAYRIRIYNGYNSTYKISIFDSSNAIVRELLPTDTPSIYRSQNTDSIAVVDLSNAPSGYADFVGENILNQSVESLNFWPLLQEYLRNKSEDEISNGYFKTLGLSPVSSLKDAPLVYEGDTKSDSGYICNAVIYPNGVIIAARSNGKVSRINLDGTEDVLLDLGGTNIQWRGLFMDRNLNVYASPHMLADADMSKRGLYRLAYGESQFVKVISLYDTNSSVETETQQNDDTIWTMCEDADGYLYAGVYAHTVRANAGIYRSSDGGVTWSWLINLLTYTPGGRHIHCIIYNEYDNNLYAIVGEINTIFKSSNQGDSWTNLEKACEGGKGTAMLATPNGIIIGSDTAYSLIMSKLYSDGTVKTRGKIWANTCFGLRRSDVTGFIYAFGKIDSSVSSLNYMPPSEAVDDSAVLQQWKNGEYGSMSAVPEHLSEWEEYHTLTDVVYKDDSIRPQHFAILRSKDEGESWEIIYKEESTVGIFCVGYFYNGECLCSRSDSNGIIKPLIISESKHFFATDGINLKGEILNNLNTDSIYGESNISNPEYVDMIVDASDRILRAFKKDGSIIIGDYFRTDVAEGLVLGKNAGAPLPNNKLLNKNTIIGHENAQFPVYNYNDNTAIGYHSQYGITHGSRNTTVGSEAMDRPSGSENVAIGYYSLAGWDIDPTYSPDNVWYCVAIGSQALKLNTGSYNMGIGAYALNQLKDGAGNMAIGYAAGKYYETVSDRLIIDNKDRSSVENTEAKSMIVGTFADSIENQELKINAKVGFNGATPQAAVQASADATDLASAITLLNEIKTALVNIGILK